MAVSKKVILLTPLPPPAGGIGSWAKRMLSTLPQYGWEPMVVDESAIGKRQIFGKSGRRNLKDEAIRTYRIWSGLWRALKDREAEVVHANIPSVIPAMLRELGCALMTHMRGRKFIMHFHCTVPNTTKGRLGVSVLKCLCRHCDMIIVLNRPSEDYLKGIIKTPVRLIPNFVASNELAEQHTVRDSVKRVLYVGGLVESKGIGEVLSLAARFPEISFRLVGKGDPEFSERAEAEKLANVLFTGERTRDEVRAEMQEADVFLFLSRFRGEGFSVALCEAMAEGLPCLVTDWAANADMIENRGGRFVPIGNLDAAEAALKEMGDPSLRREMSEWNIRKARENYLDRTVVRQYVGAYEDLCALERAGAKQ